MENEKLCILAGNREQFEHYLGSHGLTDSQAFYAYDERRLYGEKFSKVITIGTFEERRDSIDLRNIAEQRRIKS